MKKIIYSILVMLIFPLAAISQVKEAGDIYKMYTNPVIYNFDEQASWYFDLSGTTFAENEDVYIWIWSPSEPDAGHWENSSDFAKLTYVGNMVWRFDVTPTTYFNKTIDEIKASAGFWLRLKDKTGTKQSSVANVPITDFSAFATSGKPFDYYPTKFYLDDPLSIIFNANLIPAFADAATVHMHAGLNNWDIKQEYQSWLPEIVAKTQLVNMGGGFYRMDIVPRTYFGAPEGYVMSVINFLFVKDNWAATTPDYIMYAPDVPIPPDPILSFFPMTISVKDFLVITRQFNTVGQKLTYTLKGGEKTITGSFTGGMDSQKAYINLIGNYGSMDISKLTLTITDQKAKVIFAGDIPLVKVD
jgi:hypothetical protein